MKYSIRERGREVQLCYGRRVIGRFDFRVDAEARKQALEASGISPPPAPLKRVTTGRRGFTVRAR